MWEEAISIIPRTWTEDPFSHQGRFFNIPPRSVIPKPVQQPHPPLWMAASQPDSFAQVGEMGIGVLCFNIGNPEELCSRVTRYHEGLERAKPVGKFIHRQIAALSIVYCGESDKEARETASEAGMWFLNNSLELYQPWRAEHVKIPDSYRYAVQAVQQERTNKTIEDHIEGGTFCVGDPDTCIRTIKKYEEEGIDQVLCFMQFGRLPHQKIMESIKRMGRCVIPYSL
jgi:alkanesulfonate monooxygenase SsuD/methylene tetrahydromethanopterin reductase-like flavin-dependent oxidoreductase (luciferase family)